MLGVRALVSAIVVVGAVVAAIALVAGCAKRGPSQGGLPGGQQLSSFAVYSPSAVVSAGTYDDTEEIEKLGSNFFGTGPDSYKPYIGVQELIKTSATLDDLDAWLKKTVQSPPADLIPSSNTVERYANASAPGASNAPVATPSAAPAPTGMEDPFVNSFKMFGLLPAGFYSRDRGRAVMIVVLDPKQVAEHMGPTIQLLDQYDKLPTFLRGGIDQTVKKQAGFSVSDLMNTNTPMGMIVYAARNFKDRNTRVIVLVDALRQPNAVPTPHETGTSN